MASSGGERPRDRHGGRPLYGAAAWPIDCKAPPSLGVEQHHPVAARRSALGAVGRDLEQTNREVQEEPPVIVQRVGAQEFMSNDPL